MEYKTRSLTNGELKSLRKDHNANLGNLSPEKAYEVKDLILEMVLSETCVKALDDLPFRESQKVFDEIMTKTFGSEEEEKN